MKKDKLNLETNRHFTIIIDDIIYNKELTAYEKLLYVVLKTYTNKNTNTVFPSHKKLSDNMNVSIYTVKKAINGLIEKGYLKKKSGKKGIQGEKDTSNTYTLIEKIPETKEKRLISATHHSTEISTKQTTINDKTVVEKSQVEYFPQVSITEESQQSLEKSLLPGFPETANPYTGNPEHNNNYINNNYLNKNESSLVLSEEKKVKRKNKEDQTDASIIEAYTEIIKENIQYQELSKNYRAESTFFDEIITIILDVLLSTSKTIYIDGEKKNRELVKSVFMKLDYYDIETILKQYRSLTTKVSKKRQYILTMLYNVRLEGQASILNDLEFEYR